MPYIIRLFGTLNNNVNYQTMTWFKTKQKYDLFLKYYVAF